MNLPTFLVPKIYRLPDSKYNRNISVVKGFGEPTLVSDDLIESGHLLTHIWKTGITRLLPKEFSPQSILLLGLGGGSNTILVRKMYPQAKITVIEIDPQMVDIAYKFFGLKKHKNLEIIVDDAEYYVKNLGSKRFDLILVDCFVGKFIPASLQQINFIKSLYSHSRFTLINRIWGNEHHLETVFFLRKISKHFLYLKTHTQTNIIVSLI